MRAIETTRSQLLLKALNPVVTVFAGVAALTLAARLSIPVGPVPVTAQTLAVLLIGALLGPWRGLAAVATYLLAGLCGAPVFAMGGGPAYLFGPTGGYLLGFIPGVAITGWLIGRSGGKPLGIFLALVAGDVAMFAFGLAWLGFSLHTSDNLLAIGLVPFLPGEAVKLALAGLTAQVILRR